MNKILGMLVATINGEEFYFEANINAPDTSSDSVMGSVEHLIAKSGRKRIMKSHT